MKRQYVIVFILIFVCFSLSAQKQAESEPFYYYKGEKIHLQTDFSRLSIISKGEVDTEKITAIKIANKMWKDLIRKKM
ncbi:MAG: hypothetical protein LBJ72_12090 [Dysgonamonadaceae bacterium]|jgi:hypothetical protein|nr:hypothetical protein [Dysgonamonadaceae bacterium]